MRWSIEIGSSMPSLPATASVSTISSRTSRDTSGWRASSSSVPPVSALIGLNATLPSSFTQISCLNRVVTGQRKPAVISASAMARVRSLRTPLGSPKLIRLPSV